MPQNDMPEHDGVEQLRQVLNRPQLKSKLADVIRAAKPWTEFGGFEPDAVDGTIKEEHVTEALLGRWMALRVHASKVLRAEITDLLAEPVICTTADLEAAFRYHLSLSVRDATEFPAAFRRFVLHILGECFLPRSSAPFNIGHGWTLNEAWFGPAGPKKQVWESRTGLRIFAVGELPGEHHPEWSGRLVGMRIDLQSVCSELSISGEEFERLQKMFSDLTGMSSRYTAINVQIIGECTRRAFRTAVSEIRGVLDAAFQALSLMYPVAVADIRVAGVRELTFVRACLDAYYADIGRRDTLERRLRNAVHLLIEADRQQNPAATLALSFSAVEALVCSKKEGIVDELARNVATLLRHESTERVSDIKRVRKLYNSRSAFLHGSETGVDFGSDRDARKLAGGVLYAIFEWQKCATRVSGQPPSVEDFFNELEDAKVSGRRVVGVPDESEQWIGGDS